VPTSSICPKSFRMRSYPGLITRLLEKKVPIVKHDGVKINLEVK
jgi:hypothetical protein